jgi:hypothetical protein
VGNIEDPAVAAHLVVLLDLRAIMQGMSQPPKSTIFAPSARCRSYRGVRCPMGFSFRAWRRAAAADVVISSAEGTPRECRAL